MCHPIQSMIMKTWWNTIFAFFLQETKTTTMSQGMTFKVPTSISSTFSRLMVDPKLKHSCQCIDRVIWLTTRIKSRYLQHLGKKRKGQASQIRTLCAHSKTSSTDKWLLPVSWTRRKVYKQSTYLRKHKLKLIHFPKHVVGRRKNQFPSQSSSTWIKLQRIRDYNRR